MQEVGVALPDEYCGIGGLTVQSAYQYSLGLLRLPQPPTGSVLHKQ